MESWRDAVASAEGRKVDDDQTLMNATTGTGSSGGTGSGTISRRAMSNEQFAKALGSDRRAPGSSMIIDGVDYREPQPPRTVTTAEPNRPRIPLKDISSIELLSDRDIRELARTGEFPVALQGSFRSRSNDPTLGGPMTTHRDEYAKLTDPFEREQYLRARKEFLEAGRANQQFVEDLQDMQIPFTDIDALPVAAGLGTAMAGGLAAGAAIPAAGAALGLTGTEAMGAAALSSAPFLASALESDEEKALREEESKRRFEQADKRAKARAEAAKSKQQLVRENELLRRQLAKDNQSAVQAEDTGQ